jgi:hypothetical protein
MLETSKEDTLISNMPHLLVDSILPVSCNLCADMNEIVRARSDEAPFAKEDRRISERPCNCFPISLGKHNNDPEPSICQKNR